MYITFSTVSNNWDSDPYYLTHEEHGQDAGHSSLSTHGNPSPLSVRGSGFSFLLFKPHMKMHFDLLLEGSGSVETWDYKAEVNINMAINTISRSV